MAVSVERRSEGPSPPPEEYGEQTRLCPLFELYEMCGRVHCKPLKVLPNHRDEFRRSIVISTGGGRG